MAHRMIDREELDVSRSVDRGDIVRLRSGGPDMTVKLVNASYVVFCMWFDADSHVCEQGFDSELLFIVSKPRLERQPPGVVVPRL